MCSHDEPVPAKRCLPDAREFVSDDRPHQRRFADAQDALVEHAHTGHALVERMTSEVAAVQLDLG